MRVGGLVAVGFQPPGIALFAGDAGSAQEDTSDLYFFETDTNQAGPMLNGNYFGSSIIMFGTVTDAYMRDGQDGDRYNYASNAIVEDYSFGNNLGSEGSGVSNSVNAYYWGNKTIYRFPFATETETSVSSWTGGANVRNRGSASHANSLKGVVANGGSPALSTTEELTFATETVDGFTTAGLAAAARNSSAMGSTTHAYIAGGISGGRLNRIDKHAYASNTNASAGVTMTIARDGVCSASDVSMGVGIHTAGSDGTLNIMATDKVNLSNDTISAGASLSVRRLPNNSGTSNQHAGLFT